MNLDMRIDTFDFTHLVTPPNETYDSARGEIYSPSRKLLSLLGRHGTVALTPEGLVFGVRTNNTFGRSLGKLMKIIAEAYSINQGMDSDISVQTAEGGGVIRYTLCGDLSSTLPIYLHGAFLQVEGENVFGRAVCPLVSYAR